MRASQPLRAAVDARALGATCDECPLSGRCNPVLPEDNPNPKLIVVQDFPGHVDKIRGNPIDSTSEAGRIFDGILENIRVDRNDLHITSALMCTPPFGTSPKDLGAAVAACRPRLELELASIPPEVPVLVYGGQIGEASRSLQAFTGYSKIFEHIGAAQPGTLIEPVRQVVPSLHPEFALDSKAGQYRATIQIHTHRAWKLALGKLAPWQWPELYTDKDGDDKIVAALERLHAAKTLGVDVETPKIKDPRQWPELARQLLNIGVASHDMKLAVCVTWQAASSRVKAAMLALLETEIPKTMQNGSFDWMVFYYNGIVLRNWDYDTMVAWQIVAPKQKAGLGYIASVLTTAPRWKDSFKASSKKRKINDDVFLGADAEERAVYCAYDAYLQDVIRAIQKFYFDEAKARLFTLRMDNIHIGLKMRQRGVQIDKKVLNAHRGPVATKAKWAKRKLIRLARAYEFTAERVETSIEWDYEEHVTKKGVIKRRRIKDSRRVVRKVTPLDFDPGNIHHVRALFGKLNVRGGRPKKEGGADSYDAKVMEGFSTHNDQRVRVLAASILDFRQWQKILRTNLDGLPIYPDGRIHTEWKPGNTSTMRWGSSNPNSQNVQKFLRDMFVPHIWDESAGIYQHMYLLSADYSQLELRIVALLAGDEVLLEAYANGVDVHALNAQAIFGPAWDMPADGVSLEDHRKQLRDFAKRFVYGANYGASAKTLWENLVPDFPKLRKIAVELALKAWFAAHPKIKAWQQRVLQDAYLKGFVEEPASGHKHYFFGNVDPSVALNFPVQTFAAWIMNEATKEVSAALDWDSGEGILFQIHDDLKIACHSWEKGYAILKTAMEKVRELAGAKIAFPVDVSVSFRDAKNVMELKNDQGKLALPKHEDRFIARRLAWEAVEKAGFWHAEAA